MGLPETAWKDLSFVAFDTETTGKYPLESEICEIAAVKYRGGAIVDEYQTLLKPSRPMSQMVIDIHHITNEMVEKAPTIQEKIFEFHRFIQGSVCLAHHAPFDLGFISVDLESAGLPTPEEPVVCTSLLSRKMIRESSNHKLQTLIQLLNIDGGQAHRALDDAKACLQVALECFHRVGEDALLKDILQAQGGALQWSQYSMNDLLEESRFQHLIRASRERLAVDMVYDGGSRPGKNRVVEPIGIVRNPNGDFLVAIENGRLPPKRYFLNKISEAKIKG